MIPLLVWPLAYRWSLDGVSSWGATIQAIVNVGREELAAKLSLELPKKIDEEREMWERVHAFLFYPYEEDLAKQVDRFRASSNTDS